MIGNVRIDLMRLCISFGMLVIKFHSEFCHVSRIRSGIVDFKVLERFWKTQLEASKCIWTLDFMRHMLYRWI